MPFSFTSTSGVRGRARVLAPLSIGASTYLLFLFIGNGMLQDADTLWQITVGQWILDHRALPYTDIYSFTRFGEPWISTSWLSQVALATVYAQWGWAGPVILTSIAIALSVAILAYLLDEHLEIQRSVVLVAIALMLSAQHFSARPHILALPVMVAWVGVLMVAADRRSSPSWLWLPLMALWANLHGGFVLGLALIGPIALIAVWNVEAERRIALFLRWVLFGIGALIACCATPYGWKTLLGAANILSLGQALSTIIEWRPSDFTSFTPFEAALLGLIAFAFFRGIALSLPRILLILLLTWMALTHVRSIESFAFLIPLVLAKPLGGPLVQAKPDTGNSETWLSRHITAVGTLMIVATAWISTSIYTSYHRFAFTTERMPVAAVDLLQQRKAQRIFNAYDFGGYLISRNIPVFIDGRTELYGKTFMIDFVNAVAAYKLDNLTRFFEEYRIDATLLTANSPAAQVLDHIKGWKRLYADNVAVIHVRDNPQTTDAGPLPAAPH